jgi:starch-binding outer membrane protein, SusD/RagB family
MKEKYSLILMFLGIMVLTTSCLKDLDTVPLDKDVTSSEKLYSDPANYINVLAKCYLGLAVGGNSGGDGEGDISGIDAGFSQYTRGYWYNQVLTTDEAVIGWNDQTIKDLHYQTWSASDVFVTAFYYRIMFQVTLCNEFIRNSTPGKLDDRGIGSQYREEIAYYHAEARFLRALSYWHGLDLFRNIPFVTENDPIGAFYPEQKNAAYLFNYIESELIAITDGQNNDDLVDARQNGYARADKAAAWMLLAKLYLNAEVYIKQPKYTECITALNHVLESGYSLEPKYVNLFRTDNNNSNEIIFPVAFDGINTQTWGGTTILVHAAIGGSMCKYNNEKDPRVDSLIKYYGVSSGWGGIRVTKEAVSKFGDVNNTLDSRATFYTDGQNIEINSITLFTDGYAFTKFKNISSNNQPGSNSDYVDTDFPMFRLGDAYLMYAEAVLRGGTGGNMNTALGYINDLRERAYSNTSGNITSDELSLNFILDERLRELMWEGHRRTDLVRFGKFTGDKYIWAWKGLVKEGVATETYRDIFPIPTNDLNANTNLKQNPGYK